MTQNAALDPNAVRRRAHERWLEQGCPSGTAERDWLEAERELEGARARSLTTSVVTVDAEHAAPPLRRAPRSIVTRTASAPAARLLAALVPDATRSLRPLPPRPRSKPGA